ncbi:hypothetical protein [Ureibacillus aquaedulcis]|uniref:RNA helicase n=1 Tax=Ureibacillus aquaedulcis TaxID=3058421 RepID=A0ABT8GUP1_9BACL|nr:hypothetical protein [Ureibacillus sp. BA0131]MDN4494924.1 hypothetical protein [Ureibacillus sp. BA0131]
MDETVVATEVKHTKKTINVGLIMPIAEIAGLSEQHWEDVRRIIKESLKDDEKYEMNIRLVSHSDEVRVIQTSIVQNIYYDDIVVIDVSAKNANVMFEFGMRLAFDKPFVVIKDDVTPYIFDTGNIQHLEYPRDLRYTQIETFKVDFKKKVISTLEYALSNPNESMYLEQYGNLKPTKIEEIEVSGIEYIENTLKTIRRDFKRLENNVMNGTKNSNKNFFKIEIDNTEKLYEMVSPIILKYFKDSTYRDVTTTSELVEFVKNTLESRGISYSSYLLQDVIERKVDEVLVDKLPF